MEYKFKERTRIKVNYDGQLYDVVKPDIGQIEAYDEKIKSGEPVLKCAFELLQKLGLPEEVVKTWEADQFEDFVEFLVGKKKA